MWLHAEITEMSVSQNEVGRVGSNPTSLVSLEKEKSGHRILQEDVVHPQTYERDLQKVLPHNPQKETPLLILTPLSWTSGLRDYKL